LGLPQTKDPRIGRRENWRKPAKKKKASFQREGKGAGLGKEMKKGTGGVFEIVGGAGKGMKPENQGDCKKIQSWGESPWKTPAS